MSLQYSSALLPCCVVWELFLFVLYRSTELLGVQDIFVGDIDTT